MIIKGKIRNNFGAGSVCFANQKKEFVKLGLEGANKLFDGTINLDLLGKNYEIKELDHTFWGVVWNKPGNDNKRRFETFGFLKINRIIYQNKEYKEKSYLYFPSKSPHVVDRVLLEIVSPEIPDIKAGEFIEIEIEDNKLKLF